MSKTTLPVFNYKVQNSSDSSVDVYIDSDIVDASTQEIYKNYFGDETPTSYKSFRDQLNIDNLKTVNIFINSPGGQVTEAMAIHDLIVEMQSKGVKVNTKGRGIIASAATYILMAGTSEMSENSFFMIHNVAGFAYGDVNQVENQARTLRAFNDRITKFYSDRTGLSETVVGNMMNKETWLSAEEAKDKGFINKVTGKTSFTNSINPEQWQFSNMAVLNSYNSFTTKNNSEMDANKITEAITNGFNSLLDKLNLSNKKEDADVVAAINAASEGIVNSLKAQVPTNEAIQEMVNQAVANKEFKLPENLVTTEALTNLATKEEVTNATKDVANKADLEATKTAIINSVNEKIGNKANEKPITVSTTNKKYEGVDWTA